MYRPEFVILILAGLFVGCFLAPNFSEETSLAEKVEAFNERNDAILAEADSFAVEIDLGQEIDYFRKIGFINITINENLQECVNNTDQVEEITLDLIDAVKICIDLLDVGVQGVKNEVNPLKNQVISNIEALSIIDNECFAENSGDPITTLQCIIDRGAALFENTNVLLALVNEALERGRETLINIRVEGNNCILAAKSIASSRFQNVVDLCQI